MSEVKVFAPAKHGKNSKKKYRVCAYARVSTDKIEQKDSYENQVKYFTKKIKDNPDYEFVGVFADESITGTTDKRPDFQRMIAMAKSGKIDIILTKSISRFSRNVKDLMNYVDILKNHSVNVIFEEEKIELASSSGSLLLTVLGAIAQMEVQNTSEHVKWVCQKKMREGILVGNPHPFGYDLIDGKLVINEEEAKYVRDIFKWYLEGEGCYKIAKKLDALGVKNKKINGKRWYTGTVMGILRNEKYKGDLIQGKTFIANPIGHIRKRNVTKEDENESYFYENKSHHEAIISEEDFNKVQEIANNKCAYYKNGEKRGTTKNSFLSDFTSKIVCAYCGKSYVRRKAHPNTKYEKPIWKCMTICKGRRSECPKSVALDEEFIKSSVVGMIKNLLEDKEGLFYLSNERLNDLLKESKNKTSDLKKQIDMMKKNIQNMENNKSKLLDLLLNERVTEKEYIEKKKKFDMNIEKVNGQIKSMYELLDEEDDKNNTYKQIVKLIKEGKAEGFNKELFDLMVDKITIGGKVLKEEGYVDEPRSIHYALNIASLDTDLKYGYTKSGEAKYGPIGNMEKEIYNIEAGKTKESNLYTLYSNMGH